MGKVESGAKEAAADLPREGIVVFICNILHH
jgi:hypothetical protein